MVDPSSAGSDKRWRGAAAAILVFVLVFASTLAFLVLPLAQASQIQLDPWAAICRAIGIAPGTPAATQPVSTAVAQPVSKVAWDPEILDILGRGDPARGEQLALEACSACHGEDGISPSADFPHLSGQSATAIYKQLHDYKTGARQHEQMSPVAARLSDTQLADIAAYFGRGNHSQSLGHRFALDAREAAKLARVGDPARGIPACNACHASGAGGPIETPTLVGQHAAYLERQMQLYADGGRTNDVYARMREIASRLTASERRALAAYYQGTL